MNEAISRKITFRSIVENFAPSWYAMVMGTAGLSIAFYYTSSFLNWFYWVGYGLFITSVLMFVLVLVPWVLRFFIAPEKVKESFYHPVHGSFFPTMPISLLLISFAILVFKDYTFLGNSNVWVAFSLYIIGTIMVIVMGMMIIVGLFFNDKVDLSHSNFGWFIPPVAHIIFTRVGFEFVEIFQKSYLGEITFWVSLFGLGIGLFMYIFIGSIVMQRYILHEIPSGSLVPTTFIQLAPLGIFSTIFAKMTHLFPSSSIGILVLFSVLFWSFGIWWLIISVMTLISHLKDRGLPFALSWWAFVFPLVAITLGTFAVSNIASQQASIIFKWLLVGFDVITFFVWFGVLIATFRRAVRGEIF